MVLKRVYNFYIIFLKHIIFLSSTLAYIWYTLYLDYMHIFFPCWLLAFATTRDRKFQKYFEIVLSLGPLGLQHDLLSGLSQFRLQHNISTNTEQRKAIFVSQDFSRTLLCPETRNTRPPVSLLLCDNLKNRMFLQNFFS
jgi:hypothetical protein